MRKFYALIPARAGSKGIPGKNTKIIAGKPLVQWTIDAAVNCEHIEKVIVSTDITEIFEWNLDGKVEVIARPEWQANDNAQLEPILRSVACRYAKECDSLVLIQPTSPLLLACDLNIGILKYENSHYDSLLSVYRSRAFLWQNKNTLPINYNPAKRPRRQEWDGYFVENGAFYINSVDNIIRNECRLSGWNIGVYEMPANRSFEVDEPSDFDLIEQLLKGRKIETT